jgi:hypothetical protein
MGSLNAETGLHNHIDVRSTTLTRISGRFSSLSESFESCVHGKRPAPTAHDMMINPQARMGLLNAVCVLSTPGVD